MSSTRGALSPTAIAEQRTKANVSRALNRRCACAPRRNVPHRPELRRPAHRCRGKDRLQKRLEDMSRTGARILVVDAYPEADSLASMLDGDGHRVRRVGDAAEAV